MPYNTWGCTMNFSQVDLFSLASQRLQWLSDRQKTISENIANVDTVGYRAREVEDFSQYLSRSEKSGETVIAQTHEAEATWSESLSGNNVVLEEQLLAASQNSGQYRMASAVYRKAHELIISVSAGR